MTKETDRTCAGFGADVLKGAEKAQIAPEIRKAEFMAFCERTAERAADWASLRLGSTPWADMHWTDQRALAIRVAEHIAITEALTLEPIRQ